MSFLTRTAATAFRTTRHTSRATFSTSVRAQKSAVDAAKDTLKAVDRKVSDAAVKGLEKGGKSSPIVFVTRPSSLGFVPSHACSLYRVHDNLITFRRANLGICN